MNLKLTHWINSLLLALLLAGLLLAGLTLAAQSAGSGLTPAAQSVPGSLDTAFGTTGIVTTPFGSVYDDYGYAVAVQSDGKIVVVGNSWNGGDFDFALARYNTDGSLDTAFDSDGKVTTSFGSSVAHGRAVAVQSDGKIVVAGDYNTNAFALARYNTDGSLDTAFDSDGKVTTPIGNSGDDYGYAVAVQSDGKIVVVGNSWNGGDSDFALARYNTGGSLDTTFGATGIVTTPIGSGDDSGSAVIIQSDGKIVVAGNSRNSSDYDFALARYNTDGSLDTAFDSDGKVTTPFGGIYDYGSAVAVQSDGKIVVAGGSWDSSDYDFALARYNTDGSLDTAFDSDGKVTTSFLGSSSDSGRAVVIQSDGKIVVAGDSWDFSDYDFALARYNTDGSLDTAFDSDGKVTTSFGSGDDYGTAVAVQSDGKIVVAGYSDNGSNSDFALARYLVGLYQVYLPLVVK